MRRGSITAATTPDSVDSLGLPCPSLAFEGLLHDESGEPPRMVNVSDTQRAVHRFDWVRPDRINTLQQHSPTPA